jgi:16S rRNA (adenine1518-N6/adenine1519-N6)-dimethyltransferase
MSSGSVQTRSEVKSLLARHGLSPDKKLGQHFLADPNITRKIAGLAEVGPGDRVVEVGPGTGTLTAALEQTGAAVTAIEVDDSLRPILEETTSATLVFGDAAKMNLSELLAGGDWTFVSNLPYNVGTSIVLDALRSIPQIRRFVVMVQLEVAQRLVAMPGSKTYGQPSVVTSLHGVAHIALRVPPQVFVPAPRVGSAVVVIDRRPAHPLAPRAIEIAANAFNQRRKMLRKSLAGTFADPVAIADRAGLESTARPEDLDPTDFIRLAEAEASLESGDG